MRQIKFRGKRLDGGGWAYGGYAEYIHPDCGLPSPSIIKPMPECGNVNVIVQVDPATIGQFTGLLDRNGKEIYEGDIVEIRFDEDGVTTKHKCVVRWNELNAGFALYPQEQGEGPWYGWLMKNCIIIGNIHEQSKS